VDRSIARLRSPNECLADHSGAHYEMSSLARTLGSWFRNPLKAWTSVCFSSVFVLGSGLATG
jgi:hypothetical protein